MRIILTHEQADLDALASLLGAHLLDPEAFAVLPRQINRNGQAYLHKYKQELGFTSVNELPNEAITRVQLVDTQSLITLKGMSEKTEVVVIDHHPRKTHTDPAWSVELYDTGACTTILVEKIIEAGLQISTSQATLLLLGIYEDTGSLSYPMTCSRDMLAAAFLLDHGADLSVASQYMNPPLSNAQMLLYDRLMKDITTHTIHDFTILVAKANALDIQDEIQPSRITCANSSIRMVWFCSSPPGKEFAWWRVLPQMKLTWGSWRTILAAAGTSAQPQPSSARKAGRR